MTTNPHPQGRDGLHDGFQQPVDRARRAYFIFGVVGFCLVMASVFTGLVALAGVTSVYLPIIEMMISGLMSLAMTTSLAYVGGSVIDYNGGFGSMFSGSKGTKG